MRIDRDDLKEIGKDIGFGAALVVGIFLIIAGLISFMELINLTSDTIRLVIATPLFIYFCYMFGGLTRDILSRK